MGRRPAAADPADVPEAAPVRGVIFPAGNSDFRAVRNRCARACREFNATPEDADPEERTRKWLDIVRPDRNRAEDGGVAVTHDQTFANPCLKAKTPFVKPPVHIDYGVRLHIGGSTFINRNCMIMDTPVADVVIGEGCNIGPNCTIVSVTHPVRLEERLLRHSIGQPVTIGNNVWIGANVTILGGVTVGDGAVLGAGSLVKHDVPPMTVAFGVPARVVAALADIRPVLGGPGHTAGTAANGACRRSGGGDGDGDEEEGGGGESGLATAHTLAEATGLVNRLPMVPITTTGAGGGGGGGGGGACAGGRPEGRGGEEGPAKRDELDAGLGLLDLGLGLVQRRGGSRAWSGSDSGGTVTARAARANGFAAERWMVGGPGRRQPQQESRRRRLEVEAAAATAVVVALLAVFFFAGVHLGARGFSVFGD